MKQAEVQLPDAIYQQVEGLAERLQITVPELLCRAAEQMIQRQTPPPNKGNGIWQFPAGRRLGAFLAPVQDWRLLANEAAD